LISLMRKLPAIDPLELKISLFNQVRLNRNNRFYGFILNVCQIIFTCTLPTEEKGEYQFADFLKNEKKMNRLFEAFVRNFYRIECKKFPIVRSENIRWSFEGNIDNLSFLPNMITDITLENEYNKIIIDAKFYTDTLVVNFEKEKIRSSNLYQLFSYIVNQEDKTFKTMNACGILLYPTVQKDYDLEYSYGNHKIKLSTVNLNTDWTNISNRLLEIVNI
jgi:5-methylcytosine-specific restriction enzyme subunit McrC